MGMFILTQFLFLMASSKIFRGVIIYSTKKELDSFTVHIFFFLLFFLHSYLSIFFLCETPATSLCLCVNSEGATPSSLSFFQFFLKYFMNFKLAFIIYFVFYEIIIVIDFRFFFVFICPLYFINFKLIFIFYFGFVLYKIIAISNKYFEI
jgi:hypothetical protein